MLEISFLVILVHILNMLCWVGIGLWIVLGILYLARRFSRCRTGSGQ